MTVFWYRGSRGSSFIFSLAIECFAVPFLVTLCWTPGGTKPENKVSINGYELTETPNCQGTISAAGTTADGTEKPVAQTEVDYTKEMALEKLL